MAPKSHCGFPPGYQNHFTFSYIIDGDAALKPWLLLTRVSFKGAGKVACREWVTRNEEQLGRTVLALMPNKRGQMHAFALTASEEVVP